METQHLVEQIHAYKASDLKMCLMYEDLHNWSDTNYVVGLCGIHLLLTERYKITISIHQKYSLFKLKWLYLVAINQI